ncbi:hypothetical protein LCGC14_2968180, partial [marine sediment metagenome]
MDELIPMTEKKSPTWRSLKWKVTSVRHVERYNKRRGRQPKLMSRCCPLYWTEYRAVADLGDLIFYISRNHQGDPYVARVDVRTWHMLSGLAEAISNCPPRSLRPRRNVAGPWWVGP